MLAVLKAGRAFTPLDPEHLRSRHDEIVKHINAKVVLTSVQCSALWEDSACTVVTVSELSTNQLPATTHKTHPCMHPNNIAYVIFTSGSTGVPKGVILEHRAVSTSCLSHGSRFGFTSRTRTLQFSSYNFDASITEIITTLLYAGCICIPSECDRLGNLSDAINTLVVNFANLTPTVARTLQPDKVSSISTLALLGEQVDFTDWKRWQDHVQVINSYGPTECSIVCVAQLCRGDYNSGTIGKSIASVSWVVDPANHNKLAPLGSVGELLMEGPILARGYLKDLEKTKAAFISDPLWLVQGGGGFLGRQGRLYKTSDLVRYDPNGNLVCVGRKDTQVKIRGQRVELREVKHYMRKCMPEAQQTAVEIVLPSGEKSSLMLAAFLQLSNEKRDALGAGKATNSGSTAQVVSLTEVDEKMANCLLNYMILDVYFALSQLPITVSGKTDRKRLREIRASFSA
jgi:amino acid adenylation domain-containing protein